MSATLFACESINQDWIDGLIVRWKTAGDFVARLDARERIEVNALQRILRRDIPALVQELTRLRPDLSPQSGYEDGAEGRA
jgi:hypothetical protein